MSLNRNLGFSFLSLLIFIIGNLNTQAINVDDQNQSTHSMKRRSMDLKEPQPKKAKLINEKDEEDKSIEMEALALHELGMKHWNNKEIQEAFNYFIQAASQDFLPSQYALGIIYQEQGDDTTSLRWISLAAEKGYPQALHQLGMNEFRAHNYYGALSLFELAGEKDLTESQYNAGIIRLRYKDYVQALRWFKKVDRKGSSKARIKIAQTYYEMAKEYSSYQKIRNWWFLQALKWCPDADSRWILFCSEFNLMPVP